MYCLKPSVINAIFLSITFLHYIKVVIFFFLNSLHSVLSKLLKFEILHVFAEAVGAKEMIVVVLPPISVAQNGL